MQILFRISQSNGKQEILDFLMEIHREDGFRVRLGNVDLDFENLNPDFPIERTPRERFDSHGQHLCKFMETKGDICIRKEFNSHRTGLGHQHGCHFTVLGHQYGRRDVM